MVNKFKVLPKKERRANRQKKYGSRHAVNRPATSLHRHDFALRRHPAEDEQNTRKHTERQRVRNHPRNNERDDIQKERYAEPARGKLAHNLLYHVAEHEHEHEQRDGHKRRRRDLLENVFVYLTMV